jgi:hypothetical protein
LGKILGDEWTTQKMEVDFLESSSNKTYGFDIIKRVFSLKRTQITLYMVVVLWLAVATQMIVNRVFQEDFQITEAFVKTDMQGMESSLEILAQYNKDFLSEEDKKGIIRGIADAIGLKIDKEITVQKEASHSEYNFTKQAKQALTEIKVISMEQEEEEYSRVYHYIIVRMSIKQSIQSIEGYKNKIENVLKELGVNDKQVTMQFNGNYDGARSSAEKKRIARFFVEALHGEIALEYEEGDLYTIYAYTGLINEYIDSLGNKINIQIAITYDEENNKTKVTLATPVLNQSW